MKDFASSPVVIDICMPFWGDPADLRTAVASVLAQSDDRWRLTVIDDCYPDESVAEFFATIDDPRVRYRRNEHNVGITENFRRAVAAAQDGGYVVVFGSDDILHENFVREMQAALSADPGADVFQLGVTVVDAEGLPRSGLVDLVKQRLLMPRRTTTLRGEEMARSLLVGNWLYWPSLMFRVDRLRAIDFRDDLPIILDLALLIDIAFAGGSLRFVPVVSFSYRRHGSSLSQKTILDGSRFSDERAFYKDVAARCYAHGWRRAGRAARWRIMSRLHGVSVLPTVLRRGSRAARAAAIALAFG